MVHVGSSCGVWSTAFRPPTPIRGREPAVLPGFGRRAPRAWQGARKSAHRIWARVGASHIMHKARQCLVRQVMAAGGILRYPWQPAMGRWHGEAVCLCHTDQAEVRDEPEAYHELPAGRWRRDMGHGHGDLFITAQGINETVSECSDAIEASGTWGSAESLWIDSLPIR